MHLSSPHSTSPCSDEGWSDLQICVVSKIYNTFSFLFLTQIVPQHSMSVLAHEHKSGLLRPITFYSLKLDQVQEGG